MMKGQKNVVDVDVKKGNLQMKKSKVDQEETEIKVIQRLVLRISPSSNENTPAENIKEDVKRRRRNKKSNEKQEVITVSVIESTEEKLLEVKLR